MSPTDDVFDTFEENLKKTHDEILKDLDSISVDDMKYEGVSLSFGGKTYKFTELEIVDDSDIETKIRKEYKEKINSQSNTIRGKINGKVNHIYLSFNQAKEEFDRKLKKLQEKYKNAAMMPEIKKELYHKGLSVVKGSEHDELIWIYRGTYKPKFVLLYDSSGSGKSERKAIPSDFINRLKKDMFLEITTNGNKITSIVTRETKKTSNQVEYPHLKHYHQTGTSDCWGSWRAWRNARIEKPEDILYWCKEAEGVLETINQGSLANPNPSGMTRFSTIEKHVKNLDSIQTTSVEFDDDDVWEAGV